MLQTRRSGESDDQSTWMQSGVAHADTAKSILHDPDASIWSLEEAILRVQRALFLKPDDPELYSLRSQLYLR